LCTTVDPFAALGGGTCHEGGWLPPGMAITITGTFTVLDAEDGLWVIEDEHGTIYTSPTALSPDDMIDGAVVTVQGLTLPATGAEGVVALEILLIEVHQ